MVDNMVDTKKNPTQLNGESGASAAIVEKKY